MYNYNYVRGKELEAYPSIGRIIWRNFRQREEYSSIYTFCTTQSVAIAIKIFHRIILARI